MMGTIRPGIRGGLLELFYAVYEKDANSAHTRTWSACVCVCVCVLLLLTHAFPA